MTMYCMIPVSAVCCKRSTAFAPSHSAVQCVQVHVTQHNLICTNKLFSIIKWENPISESGGWDSQFEQIELDTPAQYGAVVGKLAKIACIYLFRITFNNSTISEIQQSL